MKFLGGGVRLCDESDMVLSLFPGLLDSPRLKAELLNSGSLQGLDQMLDLLVRLICRIERATWTADAERSHLVWRIRLGDPSLLQGLDDLLDDLGLRAFGSMMRTMAGLFGCCSGTASGCPRLIFRGVSLVSGRLLDNCTTATTFPR